MLRKKVFVSDVMVLTIRQTLAGFTLVLHQHLAATACISFMILQNASSLTQMGNLDLPVGQNPHTQKRSD
jgi:hypothetical protein